MIQKINTKKIQEISFYKDWCLTLMDFMISKHGEFFGFTGMKTVVINTAEKLSLKGMKTLFKENNDWVADLSISDKAELNEILTTKFGKDLSTITAKDNVKTAKILDAGVITDEDEFRLVLNHVDQLIESRSNTDEVEAYNKLLAAFETQNSV